MLIIHDQVHAGKRQNGTEAIYSMCRLVWTTKTAFSSCCTTQKQQLVNLLYTVNSSTIQWFSQIAARLLHVWFLFSSSWSSSQTVSDWTDWEKDVLQSDIGSCASPDQTISSPIMVQSLTVKAKIQPSACRSSLHPEKSPFISMAAARQETQSLNRKNTRSTKISIITQRNPFQELVKKIKIKIKKLK